MNPGAQYVFVFLDTLYFAAAFAAMVLTTLLAYAGIQNPQNLDQVLPTISFAMAESVPLRGFVITAAAVELALRLVWSVWFDLRAVMRKDDWVYILARLIRSLSFAANACSIISVAALTMLQQPNEHLAATESVLITWVIYASSGLVIHGRDCSPKGASAWLRLWLGLSLAVEVGFFLAFFAFFGCFVGCQPPGGVFGTPAPGAAGSCTPPGNYPACEYAMYSVVAVAGAFRWADVLGGELRKAEDGKES